MQYKNIYFIRFFLSLLVLIYHSNSYIEIQLNNSFSTPIFHVGTNAVYGFFVLSGFLMISTQTRKKTRIFYFQRAKRILPLYYTNLIIGIFIYLIGNGLEINILNIDLWPLIYPLILMPQIIHLNHREFLGFIEVLWSIGIEILYYLIFPTIKHLNTGFTLLLFGLLTLTSAKVNNVYINYMNYFLLGHLIYLGFVKFKDKIGGFLALAMFFTGILRYFLFGGSIVENTLFNVLLESLFCSLLLMGGITLRFNLDNWRFIKYLGDSSYSLYLSHFFAIISVIILTSNLEIEFYELLMLIIPIAYILSHVLYLVDNKYQKKLKLI